MRWLIFRLLISMDTDVNDLRTFGHAVLLCCNRRLLRVLQMRPNRVKLMCVHLGPNSPAIPRKNDPAATSIGWDKIRGNDGLAVI
jgi:hypothetical protein